MRNDACITILFLSFLALWMLHAQQQHEWYTMIDDRALLASTSELELDRRVMNPGLRPSSTQPFRAPRPTTLLGYDGPRTRVPTCAVHSKDFAAYRHHLVLVSFVHPITKVPTSIYCLVIGSCDSKRCTANAARHGNDFVVIINATSCRHLLGFDPARYTLFGTVRDVGLDS